jgi:hypothetical protein
MILLATSRREGAPVACAYGAAPDEEGRIVTCGLLFLMRGQTRQTLVLRDPASKNRYRVRLPKTLLGQKGHARVLNIDLEVIREPQTPTD